MKVRYKGNTGHFDGLTYGQWYEVSKVLETQYVIRPNDLGSVSTISKDKFDNGSESIRDEIKQLPDGVRSTTCYHLNPSNPEKKSKVSSMVVYLEEIENEVGYHGVCPTCKTKFFSQANGAF